MVEKVRLFPCWQTFCFQLVSPLAECATNRGSLAGGGAYEALD